MLDLPSVTLVVVETRAHELARLAMLDTLRQITFAEVVVHTNRPGKIDVPGARYVEMQNCDKGQFNTYVFRRALPDVNTSHSLFLEWDAGLHDVACWSDEFLKYDYIGAPWTFGSEQTLVGNGGFSLRSKRLSEHVAAHGIPEFTGTLPEYRYSDVTLCRSPHRTTLEKAGFTWAPVDLAWKFAAESQDFQGRSFGFHRCYHWPRVLDHDELQKRYDAIAVQPDNGPRIWYRDNLLEARVQ